MAVNPDFRDLLKNFNAFRVEYMVVGATALAYYARPRFTKDLDVWVNPTPQNAARIWKALRAFGAPLVGLSEADFTNPRNFYQVGLAPNRVDVIMGLAGLEFGAAWARCYRTVFGDVRIYVISRDDFLQSKKISGRPQDLIDITEVQRAQKVEAKRKLSPHRKSARR